MSMNICHDFRYGKIIYNNLDMFVGKSLKLYGEFSPGEGELFDQFIKEGDIVVEVGSNIGSHTIHLAQLAGNNGIVYAFEPQRLVFQILAGNIALNNIINTFCTQACVSDAPGVALVPVLNPEIQQNWGGMSLENSTHGEKVPVITLDSLDLPGCDFLKVDVEGMELNVLKGAKDLIDTFRPKIYAEADRDDKIVELFRYIDSLDYDLYFHQPPYYSPDNYFKNLENHFPNVVSQNVLCIPRELNIKIEGLTPIVVEK